MQQLFAFLLLTGVAFAVPLDLRVTDASGAPLKDVLVIVINLNNGEEVARQLTDAEGRVSKRQLLTGLHRAIAAMPYGLWRTSVKEFWASETSADVQLTLQPLPTHGYGDIVPLGTTNSELQVIGTDGTAAAGAEVIVRDREATLYLERRYRTDSKGRVKIELVADPTVVVAAFAGNLKTVEVGSKERRTTIRLAVSDTY